MKDFIEFWRGKGYEKGQSQTFWLNLLQKLGIENPFEYITFEDKVVIDHTSFIDGYISETKVLIEQKSIDKDLRKSIKQSDGTLLNPFQQAKRYSAELPYSNRPRWIVTSNFKEFLIYDMENPTGEPTSLLLENLDKEQYKLGFLIKKPDEHIKREMEISIKAGELVGLLYDATIKQYKDPTNVQSLESLNMFCVRIVFCLYAEDAGIFGKKSIFHDYIQSFSAKESRQAIKNLFSILNTKSEDRDPYIIEENPILESFPYVNGGLFANENIEIPMLTDEILTIILSKADEDFNWSDISPTIFGALFESTLNPETRRAGGMHYTSIENIHKVIDPLFLNDLNDELDKIMDIKIEKSRNAKLLEFQRKLSKLKFLDPACGSGNFLTETYISLRKLENKILETIYSHQMVLDINDLIKVSISQFYGIEINDMATTVAKTALWIAESQMLQQTEEIIHMNLDFLPLKSYANIVQGNALTIDWESVISKEDCSYIMGNPPFLGARMQSKEQKQDLLSCFDKKAKNISNLDYVTGWYMKASIYIYNTKIQVAFVSTNSIAQGEQVAILWTELLKYNIDINFAYRSFIWTSEATERASVYCVIIGFANITTKVKYLYSGGQPSLVEKINSYLVESDFILIQKSTKNIFGASPMEFGSMPNDGGFLSKYSQEDIINFEKQYPKAKGLFKLLYGAEEFINNKTRYCLWLDGVSPSIYAKISPIMEAIENTKVNRLSSTREATKKLADVPYLFGEIRQPKTDYLLVPSTSSENRKYVPIGYMSKDIIASNAVQTIADATLYEFGVITSNVHMAWLRTVGGRLKSDYRYSATIVYNTFPWPTPTDKQRMDIEKTAQAILDARALYPEDSLATLYNELTMPKELRKAHQDNDRAVMKAYGMTIKGSTESDCVAELMKLYSEKVAKRRLFTKTSHIKAQTPTSQNRYNK
ncbi:MAG: methylase [Epulopiscium sp. Nele67-Bin005]|nr:MAG: methylase [Epulopiscium sp. Nele67-Bin005]